MVDFLDRAEVGLGTEYLRLSQKINARFHLPMRQPDSLNLLFGQPVQSLVFFLRPFTFLFRELQFLINDEFVLANYIWPIFFLIVLEYFFDVHMQTHELRQTLLTKQTLSLQVHLRDAFIWQKIRLLNVFPLSYAVLLQERDEHLDLGARPAGRE